MAKKAKSESGGDQGTNGAGGGGENIAGYFRKIFAEKPRLLKERSNDELYRRWLEDHPGHSEVPPRVRTGLQNVKSVLRSKLAKKKGAKQAQASAPAADQGAQRGPRRVPSKALESLEYQIDECLALAKTMDAEALGDVVGLLRRARNAVIVKLGTD
jgi:hypothetical protein